MTIWRFHSIVTGLIAGFSLLVFSTSMWGQNIEDMNKSELREFGAACQRDLEGLRTEIEALNNELTETKNDLLYQILDLEDLLSQQESQHKSQLRQKQLERESHELTLRQLLQTKSAYIGRLQRDLFSTNNQAVLSHGSNFLRGKAVGSEFGDHNLQFELIGIHVKRTAIPTIALTGFHSEEETYGNLYKRSEFKIRILKPMQYNPGITLNSPEGRKIFNREFDFPLYAGSWTNNPEFSDFMSIRADVLRGKLLTFSFGNRVTSDFFLSGIETKEKSWNSSTNRTVLKLVNSEEQGIELDIVSWNEEAVLAITPDAPKELGADFSFGKDAKSEVEVFLNGRTDYNHSRGLEYNVQRYGDDAIISAEVEVGKMEFFLPCSDCCDGSYPVQPNFLLFRVVERADAAEAVGSELPTEDSASAHPRRVSIMQAETMPSISTCSHADPVQNLECFELELLSIVEENIKYPPIARDAGIQGVVMVSFVLTSGGTIEDIRVLQPVDKRLDAEAVSVLSRITDSATIEPARIEGKAVDVEMCLPVPFVLW